jgi:hypothetical protein
MREHNRSWLVLILLVVFGYAAPAWAAPDEPRVEAMDPIAQGNARPLNIGVLAGYGMALGGPLTLMNPYGTGFGLQVDYMFESQFVLGIGGDFFMGEAKASSVDALGVAQPATSARYAQAHLRIGYSIRFEAMGSWIDLRPSIWFGVAAAMLTNDARFPNGRAFGTLVAPGLSVHYMLGSGGWYLGEDIRLNLPLDKDRTTGALILLTLGKRV